MRVERVKHVMYGDGDNDTIWDSVVTKDETAGESDQSLAFSGVVRSSYAADTETLRGGAGDDVITVGQQVYQSMGPWYGWGIAFSRSVERTSGLQTLTNVVGRVLLDIKKGDGRDAIGVKGQGAVIPRGTYGADT